MREREYQLDEKGLVFQHVASETLRCFARLQEQGTFGIEKRLSSKNVLVGERGKYVRLGCIKVSLVSCTCRQLEYFSLPG